MKASAPGKLILTGEHAVVFGRPAVAMAVDRSVRVKLWQKQSPQYGFHLLNFKYRAAFPWVNLQQLKRWIDHHYQLFLKGQMPIQDVLKLPVELIQYALVQFLEHFRLHTAPGLNFKIRSDIPVGCGMGSSAAVVLSVFRTLAAHFKLSLSSEDYAQLGRQAESLQHGYSSGVDVYTSLRGGCVCFEEQKPVSSYEPLQLPLLIVNTGTPVVSTGESVAHVRDHFEHDTIWNDFEAVAREWAWLLERHTAPQLSDIQPLIRENHRLLRAIGVVPDIVHHFIQDLEKIGAVAKVCGAGSVVGDRAGVVLVLTDHQAAVKSLCAQYGYDSFVVRGIADGLKHDDTHHVHAAALLHLC